MPVVNGETYKQKGECTTAKYVRCCCLPNTLTIVNLWGKRYKLHNYTPEVRGSSVWQISKKYFAEVISHVLVVQLETFSP